ncbi:MAG: extracellular solute-binding protein [Chloroflexota bacterium]
MQHKKNRLILSLGTLFTVLLASISLVPVLAQQNTIITVGIQEWQQQFLNDEVFEEFEANNPNVDVVLAILDDDLSFFAPPQSPDDVSEYFENVNTYASQADVLPIQDFNNPRLRTRAGMYLDIAPLLNADPDANVDDFYPVLLQSMQWDNGTWGLPMTASVQVVVYDQNAFDEAGVPYPSTSWTLSDFTNAGATLAEVDADGRIVTPGFFSFDTAGLFASLLDSDFSDPSAFPSLPLINTPEIVALLTEWQAYQEDWLPDTSEGFNFDFGAVPLQIEDTFRLNNEFNFGNSDVEFEGELLPNGRSTIRVQGYGISAGTNNPQLAYDLLQYMTTQPEIAFAFFGDVPARQSLLSADTSELEIFRPDTPPELQAFIDEALTNAIPSSDLHFAQLLNQALFGSEDQDIETALQELQEEQVTIYQAIDEARVNNTVVEVATPIPTPVLSAGEVSLTFGVESNFGPSLDRTVWQTVIDEFVAQDPQVGQITLNSEFFSLEERAEEQDCFYLASNPVQVADLTLISPVGPFLSTDANLNMDNFVSTTLDQVTRDGTIWAMPLAITPQVIWYNPDTFDELGLPQPSNDWTISQFVDVLNTLAPELENAPYRTQSFGGNYLYMLIAAYGGLPIDYSEELYSFNLSDSAVINAIQQVAQLVEDDLIDYQELANFGGGGGFGSEQRGMFDDILSPDGFRIQNRAEGFNDSRVVMFPRGEDYTPLSYGLGTGLISANTPAPDACYRWLSFLSRQPELLSGMPTQIDLFDEAVSQLSDADDLVALYQAYTDALASPNVIVFPSPFSNTGGNNPVAGISNFIKENWINGALDDIMADGVDVETALVDAQQFINDYDACSAGLDQDLPGPIAELSDDEINEFFRGYAQCAVDVDPELSDIFGPILEEDDN